MTDQQQNADGITLPGAELSIPTRSAAFGMTSDECDDLTRQIKRAKRRKREVSINNTFQFWLGLFVACAFGWITTGFTDADPERFVMPTFAIGTVISLGFCVFTMFANRDQQSILDDFMDDMQRTLDRIKVRHGVEPEPDDDVPSKKWWRS